MSSVGMVAYGRFDSVSKFPCSICNSPFPFSNSEKFTVINAVQLRFLKRLVELKFYAATNKNGLPARKFQKKFGLNVGKYKLALDFHE